MSLQTLKRKTNARYNNNSVGFKQFSIEGSRRNQGYVGQDVLGRTILKTPFRGNTPQGYGGCCGDYPVSVLTPYGTCTVEDSSIVKSSVLSNYGSIHTHYRWITRPAPFISVKPDSNFGLNLTEGVYLQRLRKRVINSIDVYNETHSTIPPVRTIVELPAPMSCPLTTKVVGPLTSSQYTEKFEKACTIDDPLPISSICRTPIFL
jgi:hypothetical protein